jgi:GTP-binding protein HflX
LPPDLLAAFRATLEEINESNLLLHLVDASNDRWQQQLESVERILSDLEFGKIPRLVVFNKSDLVSRTALEPMMRLASQNGERQCIAISSLQPESLGPLLDQAGILLARDLTFEDEKDHEMEVEAITV